MRSLCTPDICDGTGDDPKCPHCNESRKREVARNALRAEGAAAERVRINARVASEAQYRTPNTQGDGQWIRVDAVLALLQSPDAGER